MKSKIFISLISILALCSCTTSSWIFDDTDSSSSSGSTLVYYRVVGTLVDIWGDPVENIKVTANDSDDYRTESDGTFSVFFAEYYGTAIKITFTDDDVNFDSNDGDYETLTIGTPSDEEPTYINGAFQYDLGTTTINYE